MSRNKLLAALVILVCPFLITKSAQASSISLLGIDNISQNTSTIVTGTNGKNVGSSSGYGGGILVDLPVSMRMGIETGLLFYDRNWTDNNGANNFVSQVYEIPVLLKLHFLGAVSVGVGGYYTTEPGNLGETGGTTNPNLSYSTYGLNTSDYGVKGEVTLHIPLSAATALRIDGAYNYGLQNSATGSGNTFDYRNLQVMAGFQFMLGGERHK